MKSRLAVLAIVATLALAGGCKSKPSLVGEWTGNIAVQGVTVDTSFLFGSDGTVSVKQSANGQTSTQKGTYKEEEKSFTMTAKSVESASIPKSMLDPMNAELAKNPKTVTFTLEWKDGDTIAVSQQGAQAPYNVPITLKRKK